MRYPYACQEDFYLLENILNAGKILCKERKAAVKDLQSCDQVTQTVIDMYDHQMNQARTEKERENLLMQKNIALKKCYDDFNAFEVAAREINNNFKQKYGRFTSAYAYLDPNTPVDNIESSSDFTGMHAVVKPSLTEDFPFHNGILTVEIVAYTSQRQGSQPVPASLQVVAEMTVKSSNHPDTVIVRDLTRPETFLIDYSNDSPNVRFENEPPF